MDARDRSQAERIAYHEAGHAVAATLTDSTIAYIQRVGAHAMPCPGVYFYPPADTALRVSKRRPFMVALAGMEAERRFCLSRGWDFDWRESTGWDWSAAQGALTPALWTWASVQEHGRPQRLDESSRQRWRKYFLGAAADLFEDPSVWSLTERLAQALLDERSGMLEGPRLQKVLRAATGPIMLSETQERICSRLLHPSGYPSSSSYKLANPYPRQYHGRLGFGPVGHASGGEGGRGGGLHAQHATHAHGGQGSAGRGGIHVQHENPEQVKQAMHHLFRWELSDGEVAGIAGAQPGDSVKVKALGNGKMLHIAVTGPGITPSHTMWHDVFRSSQDGTLLDHLAYVHVANGGHGEGARIFADIVRKQSRLGVDHIALEAARSDIPGQHMNGYYTWARLGVNGRLTAEHLAGAPRQFQGLTTIRDLMHAPGGRDWWRQHGNLWYGKFDLRPGSQSWRDLNDYLHEKGQPPL